MQPRRSSGSGSGLQVGIIDHRPCQGELSKVPSVTLLLRSTDYIWNISSSIIHLKNRVLN